VDSSVRRRGKAVRMDAGASGLDQRRLIGCLDFVMTHNVPEIQFAFAPGVAALIVR